MGTMDGMVVFSVLANVASFVSLGLAVVALKSVNNIKKELTMNNASGHNVGSQSIKGSNNQQAVGDIKR